MREKTGLRDLNEVGQFVVFFCLFPFVVAVDLFCLFACFMLFTTFALAITDIVCPSYPRNKCIIIVSLIPVCPGYRPYSQSPPSYHGLRDLMG